MNNPLTLDLEQPKGNIAEYVQAIWFAHTCAQGEIWLPSDGATGIVLPVCGKAYVDGQALTLPFDLQGPSTQAKPLHFCASTRLFGIRFYPGALAHLRAIQHPLVHYELLEYVAQKLTKNSDLSHFKALLADTFALPIKKPHASHCIQKMIKYITELTPLEAAYQQTPMGQRQLERHIKQQCGMTPKHLSRIYRVRQAKEKIQQNPQQNLAQLALDCHFADQSHLIREFKNILKITPAKYRKLLN